MQLPKDKDFFYPVKFIFVLPAEVQWATLLCHSLVPHTAWQRIMTIFFLLAFLLLIIYCGLLLYYRKAWTEIPDYKVTGSKYQVAGELSTINSQLPPLNSSLSSINYQLLTTISVIIPARNEAANLYDLLTSLTHQTYPAASFEVLVVDDYSTDGTASIVKNFPASNIQLISLQEILRGEKINSYKKKAIEVGVAASKGELIITTDADCVMAENWLQTIVSYYENYKPELLVMPVAILPSPVGEGLGVRSLGIFQALDFISLQGITGASVYKKIHSMCNGANLAYTRKAFNAVEGFNGIDSIASGDDMLLMHKISKQYPGGISYLKSKDVIVQTQPMYTIGDFLNQRIRWASKANKYDDKRITAVLLIVYFLNVLLLIIPFLSLANSQLSIIHYPLSIINCWLLMLLIKTLVELFFLFPVAKFFNKSNILWFFPIAQPFHIIYTVIAGFLGLFGKYKWKERKVK